MKAPDESLRYDETLTRRANARRQKLQFVSDAHVKSIAIAKGNRFWIDLEKRKCASRKFARPQGLNSASLKTASCKGAIKMSLGKLLTRKAQNFQGFPSRWSRKGDEYEDH